VAAARVRAGLTMPGIRLPISRFCDVPSGSRMTSVAPLVAPVLTFSPSASSTRACTVPSSQRYGRLESGDFERASD